MTASPDLTGLLLEWNEGNDAALEKLTPLVYSELRRIAQACMAGERPGHTLQASALVNEAFLKLIDTRRVQWKNRAHFFAMSAKLMRRILVDFARRKRFQKRDGGLQVTLDDNISPSTDRTRDLVEVQYQKGAASLLEYLDAERTYIGTMVEYLNDLASYWVSVFQLEQAVGVELH